MPPHWPTTWIAGWPTSRSQPGASRSRAGPDGGHGADRTAVTAAGVAVVAGLAGLVALAGVQAQADGSLRAANGQVKRANAELAAEKARVQERYDLAIQAIKTFHTGVSEDFLLKEARFKDLRDRLLKSASDFYGKFGAILKNRSDIASRKAMLQANFELAELTDKVGKPDDALAAHRQVLAAREVLAAETPADPELQADFGRSRRRSPSCSTPPDEPASRRRCTEMLRHCFSSWPRRLLRPPRRGLSWLNAGRIWAGYSTTPAATTWPCQSTASGARDQERWPPPPGRLPSRGGNSRTQSTGSPFC